MAAMLTCPVDGGLKRDLIAYLESLGFNLRGAAYWGLLQLEAQNSVVPFA
jgi:hypothetical protein